MPNSKIEAPPNPEAVAEQKAETAKERSKALKDKGTKRTPAEAAELLDLLLDRVAHLEARL